ncbi:DUF427 domain-containing protein [Mesorhizobium sp. ORM6]
MNSPPRDPPALHRLRRRFYRTRAGAIVASSERAKLLYEDGRNPVFYIPIEDIYFELFEKTTAASESPWGMLAVGAFMQLEHPPIISCGLMTLQKQPPWPSLGTALSPPQGPHRRQSGRGQAAYASPPLIVM